MKHFLFLILLTFGFVLRYEEAKALFSETCYTSLNDRGEVFWLHINYDKYGRANRIRYNDKTTSIPLSYFGKERKYFSKFSSFLEVSTYYETYKGKVTGILYLTDDILDEGIHVLFERVKDKKLFIFEICDMDPGEQ